MVDPRHYWSATARGSITTPARGRSTSECFRSAQREEIVPMPQLAGMYPLDLSPDRSEILLAQFVQGGTRDRPIWIASTLGGPPRRLGDLTAYDVRMSPMGNQILYTTG